MKLTRYGTDVIVVTLLLALGLFVAGMFIEILPLRILLVLLSVLLAAFTVYFFRDPERAIPDGSGESGGIVLSPADGKVVVVKDLVDEEYVKGPAKQISIFLSPLNVHVNRAPISGTVEHFQYNTGQFVAAFHDKASDLNERTHIGISNGRIRVLTKQIAGAIARRIVCRIGVGDTVAIGERFGMIKFGSRTDVIVPAEMIVDVTIGQMVVGGETVLCHLPND
jgi:phosphatidylserine decarboxylase